MGKQTTEEFIRQKMKEAADAYEERLNADPSLDHIQVTDNMREDIKRRIAVIDAEEAAGRLRPLPENGLSGEIRIGGAPKRSRYALRAAGIAAAIAVLAAGISMTSEANRIRLANIWNSLLGREGLFQLKNEDEPEEKDLLIQNACGDILEKTGIRAIQFMYMPRKMVYANYTADSELKIANIFYNYQDTVLSVKMAKDIDNSVLGQTFDGEILDTFFIETGYGTVDVMEIQGPDEKDYAAELLYDNCQYTIFGILPREEFVKMIENINLY